MLSDQDTGFENKARVRKLPLQVFTAPDAQKPETEKQNKKETEASLNADNDTYNGPECSQEQIELVLPHNYGCAKKINSLFYHT